MNRFEVVTYESADELKKAITRNMFSLSENIYESNRFIKMKKDNIELGFIYYDVGLKPQIKLIKETQKLFFGINKLYKCMDYSKEKIVFKGALPSLLFEIITTLNNEYIIFICELDVLVYQNDGKPLWKIGTRDMLKNYYLKEDKWIILEDEADYRLKISLKSGEIIL